MAQTMIGKLREIVLASGEYMIGQVTGVNIWVKNHLTNHDWWSGYTGDISLTNRRLILTIQPNAYNARQGQRLILQQLLYVYEIPPSSTKGFLGGISSYCAELGFPGGLTATIGSSSQQGTWDAEEERGHTLSALLEQAMLHLGESNPLNSDSTAAIIVRQRREEDERRRKD